MIFRKPCPNRTPIAPRTYGFLEPVTLRIRRQDGSTALVSYGIGEQVQVLEPVIQYAIVCTERLKEIPLADGTFIIDVPEDIRVEVR